MRIQIKYLTKKVPLSKVGGQEKMNYEMIGGIMLVTFFVAGILFVIISVTIARRKWNRDLFQGGVTATYYQLFYGNNWSFFEPSFGMAKIKKSQKKWLWGLFYTYKYKTLWTVGPIKSGYGRPYITDKLIELVKKEHGEVVEKYYKS